MKLEVIESPDTIRIEEGDRFVEGKAKLSFGLKRKIQHMQRPSKIKVDEAGNEKSPVTMYMDDDYKAKEDVDLYILYKRVTDWSNEEKVSWSALQNDENLGDLLEKFVEVFKKKHGFTKDEEDEEKKPD